MDDASDQQLERPVLLLYSPFIVRLLLVLQQHGIGIHFFPPAFLRKNFFSTKGAFSTDPSLSPHNDRDRSCHLLLKFARLELKPAIRVYFPIQTLQALDLGEILKNLSLLPLLQRLSVKFLVGKANNSLQSGNN